MAAQNRGLGRGLEALLGPAREPQGPSRDFQELPLDLLQPGRFQPRRLIDADSIAELAESIRAQGLVQPLLVRPLDNAAGSEPRSAIGRAQHRGAQVPWIHW